MICGVSCTHPKNTTTHHNPRQHTPQNPVIRMYHTGASYACTMRNTARRSKKRSTNDAPLVTRIQVSILTPRADDEKVYDKTELITRPFFVYPYRCNECPV